MFTPFIISFREGIEIFLVIIPLVVYFNRNKLYGMTKSALLGSALGLAIAAITGFIIFSQVALLNGPAGELFDGLLGIVLAGLILYSVVLLRKNKSFDTIPDQQFISLS
jgi:high-affinity iron transporter